jgi:hypothetical protein
MGIYNNLKALNLAASLICAAALWALLRMIGVSIAVSVVSLLGFTSTNGFISLSRSGSSWLPGLAFVLVGCVSCLAADRRTGALSRYLFLLAGMCCAFSTLLWVPYVLCILPVVCSGLLNGPRFELGKTVWRAAIRIVPVALALIVSAYIGAIALRHIGGLSELLVWIRDAGHGEGRDRQLIRLFFGLPRSFFLMGDDGILWKQFLFHDPFAEVTLFDVFTAGTWKIVLFAITAAVSALAIARNRALHGTALWALTGIVPTLCLAVLFEAGSVERYLALYPAAFVISGALLSAESVSRPVRAVILLFLLVLPATNVFGSLVWRVDRRISDSIRRISSLERDPAKTSIFVLTGRDELLDVFYDPAYSTGAFPVAAPLMPVLAGQAEHWQQIFAAVVDSCWVRGGEVWITRRAWYPAPRREWLWVENDSPAKWSELRRFVTGFMTDRDAGGPDGFLRVANSPFNRARVNALKP